MLIQTDLEDIIQMCVQARFSCTCDMYKFSYQRFLRYFSTRATWNVKELFPRDEIRQITRISAKLSSPNIYYELKTVDYEISNFAKSAQNSMIPIIIKYIMIKNIRFELRAHEMTSHSIEYKIREKEFITEHTINWKTSSIHQLLFEEERSNSKGASRSVGRKFKTFFLLKQVQGSSYKKDRVRYY